MGLIERYGTGIKRVRELFVEYQLPEPEFKLLQDGFWVKVKARHKLDDRLDEKLSQNQMLIIQLISQNLTISITELSKKQVLVAML